VPLRCREDRSFQVGSSVQRAKACALELVSKTGFKLIVNLKDLFGDLSLRGTLLQDHIPVRIIVRIFLQQKQEGDAGWGHRNQSFLIKRRAASRSATRIAYRDRLVAAHKAQQAGVTTTEQGIGAAEHHRRIKIIHSRSVSSGQSQRARGSIAQFCPIFGCTVATTLKMGGFRG